MSEKVNISFEGFPELPDLPNCEDVENLTNEEKMEVMLLIGLFRISKIENGIDNINVFTGKGTQYLKTTDARRRLMMMLNKTFVIMKNGNIYIPDNPCRILIEDRIRYKYTPHLGHNPVKRPAIFYKAVAGDKQIGFELFSLKGLVD